MLSILSKIILPVLDKILPDEKSVLLAKSKLIELEQKGELSFVESQSKILISEATNKSSLTRLWRPITMLTFVFIIVSHYFFIPILNGLSALEIPNPNLPIKMWSLMEIGIGGYVIGRSVEKSINLWKKDK